MLKLFLIKYAVAGIVLESAFGSVFRLSLPIDQLIFSAFVCDFDYLGFYARRRYTQRIAEKHIAVNLSEAVDEFLTVVDDAQLVFDQL